MRGGSSLKSSASLGTYRKLHWAEIILTWGCDVHTAGAVGWRQVMTDLLCKELDFTPRALSGGQRLGSDFHLFKVTLTPEWRMHEEDRKRTQRVVRREVACSGTEGRGVNLTAVTLVG